MVTTLIDITGQKFGRLRVIERSGTDNGQATWLCECECGNRVVVRGHPLRSGRTRSCGCLATELTGKRVKKHGKSGTRLYDIWTSMIYRCFRPENKAYHNYGGRGISVCDEWKDDFLSFRRWALAHGYSNELTIDRKDNNGDYSPENCRWATRKEQGRNTRANRHLTIEGQTKTLSEWAEKYGIASVTIIQRIKYGWDIKRAITTPVRRKANA